MYQFAPAWGAQTYSKLEILGDQSFWVAWVAFPVCELQQLSVSFLGNFSRHISLVLCLPKLGIPIVPCSGWWILLYITEITLNGFNGLTQMFHKTYVMATAQTVFFFKCFFWPTSHKPNWALRRPTVPPYFLDWVPGYSTVHHLFFFRHCHS